MIWRDDDVGAQHVNKTGEVIPGTRIRDLRFADDILQRFGVPHTIAVMAAGLDQRPELVDLIKERRMLVQLHCWTHEDLTVDAFARDDLERAVDMLQEKFGTRPTVLYPPWNRTSPEVENAAARLGLTVSFVKLSLSQYIRVAGVVAEDVINFHHWHKPDVDMLEPALIIAATVG